MQSCITKPKVETKSNQVAREGKQIGIMGGTFNPIHIAHLVMADQVLTKLHLDEIWFIPDNIPPHKKVAGDISAKDRCAMLELAVHNHPNFKVKLFEVMRGGVSYTIDTLRYLKRQQPNNKYFLIMGADQVNGFDSWKDAKTIAILATLVGVKRPNYSQESKFPMIWVDAPDFNISSTYIRQSIEIKNSIRYLVPEDVRLYIEKKGLYRGRNSF